MRVRLRFCAILLLGLLLCACAGREPPPSAAKPIPPAADAAEPVEPIAAPAEPDPEPVPEPAEPDPKTTAIDALLERMTLEEKVGQMFFVRCPELNAVEKIGQYHLGGYLLFTQDFKDAAGEWLTAEAFTDKIASYQEASDIPLFIGVDEEGGTVVRASRNPNLFPEKFQSPQKVYAAGGVEGIRQDAMEKSAGLLSIGINVNFAPVADVSTDPADFIYARAFGQDAETTAEFVQTVVTAAGQVRYQFGDGPRLSIGSVLKHFPGYGNNVDTHTGIAIDERPYEQFVAEDFLPFQEGIVAGAGSVLVSHNVVTCMDPNLPASLSPEVHRILREELGFDGVVLTDDLAMDAVEAYAEDGSVAVLAVQAGNDMIVTTDFETQIPLVIAAVEDGAIDEDRIDTALRRVLGWKYDLGLLEEAPETAPEA